MSADLRLLGLFLLGVFLVAAVCFMSSVLGEPYDYQLPLPPAYEEQWISSK